MLEALRNAKRRTVGAKETLKAVQNGQAKAVYIARDADEHVVRPLREALAKSSLPVYEAESMKALGRACGIEVGAAAAALLA